MKLLSTLLTAMIVGSNLDILSNCRRLPAYDTVLPGLRAGILLWPNS